ncbi:facilitated trehalose transporter Tret1-like [Athalia rosae]|uniref:facilitated trehalose transporter Tret1-like n=1 Tax=Athalia rosae TaxID=37344 RepID=UPI00203330D4|nr:facilitated trehalose transporter Tret1-like [Athalia rosae]
MKHAEILWLQYAAGIASMLVVFTNGIMAGWTSPYIAKLTAVDSPLPITKFEASWIASMQNLGRLVGALPGALTVSYFGSKKTLLFGQLFLSISWICLIFADSATWLGVARTFSGISYGIAFTSFPIFLGEIASPSIRGKLIALTMTGRQCGSLLGKIVGAYKSTTVFGYISLIPTGICILIFSWLPESPYHLARQNKIQAAKDSIERYNPRVNPEAELECIRVFVNSSKSGTIRDKLRECMIPENRNAGMIVVVLFFFMHFSGLNSIGFYMESVFTDGGLTVIRPAEAVIITSSIGILSGFVSVFYADKCGRRIFLTASSFGVAVSLFALGTYYALFKEGSGPAGLQWLLLASIVMWESTVCTGVFSVPSMMLSELIAPNIKNIASFVSNVSIGLFSFLATITYQPMIDGVGEENVYWSNAALMVLAMIFALTMMPETKGKTLQEIQNILHGK